MARFSILLFLLSIFVIHLCRPSCTAFQLPTSSSSTRRVEISRKIRDGVIPKHLHHYYHTRSTERHRHTQLSMIPFSDLFHINHDVILDAVVTTTTVATTASTTATGVAAESAAAVSSSLPSNMLSAVLDLGQIIPDIMSKLPFSEDSGSLFNELDIGSALESDLNGESIDEVATGMVLQSIGQDILLFLAATVIVTPLSKAVNITPILGYLVLGALLGPHGLDVFSNSKADVELGDFGILFLLFSEGLEVSTSRLSRLADFLPLGLAQLSLCAGALSVGLLLVAPALEKFIPLLDTGLIDITSPMEALILALAGTLSTSAFVFPVLKEREWEEEQSGQAATSILLLQDLAVAPLLVFMPFVVGQGQTDYAAIGFLTAKATIGFGSVIFIGSLLLRRLFDLIAKTRSTETFVALCLLVSVGVGEIAKGLGLTDTAGAFAAGVLLANTNYRAQIQADILPFKGILLGIFFMGAGSSFDTDTVITEFPTVICGALGLIVAKAITLFLATRVPEWMERNRLPLADGIRLSLLLAGGGEFAFVVLASAEKLGVLPTELGSLLTAIVLITMSVTPFLGELAEVASKPFLKESDTTSEGALQIEAEGTNVASDSIVVCGYGEIGEACLRALCQEYQAVKELDKESSSLKTHKQSLPGIVAFDSDPSLSGLLRRPSEDAVVLFGDASNPAVLLSSGISDPSAIFVAYEDMVRVVSATTRLRSSFPDAPIYTRAPTRGEAQALKDVGATEVVIESDELPRSATTLVWSSKNWLIGSPERLLQLSMTTDNAMVDGTSKERLARVASVASGTPLDIAKRLLVQYQAMDQSLSRQVSAEDVANLILNSNASVHSDDEIEEIVSWIKKSIVDPLDFVGFCRFYSNSSRLVQEALAHATAV